MLSGNATPAATRAYAAAHPDINYSVLDESGLLVSPAGFGGYRIDASDSTFHRALRRALLRGINLVDTSTNYAEGGSEELVGIVMRRLSDEAEVAREAVVVVSKVGYLQGRNYRLSQQRKAAGQPFPDLVEYAEGIAHCIHPAFLQDQLARSLERLQMETLDAYLLHNPEYYLSWAARQEIAPADAQEEYYRRLEMAFRHLEEEVAAGRIRFYGVSSNSFVEAADSTGHTSLARLWQIAEKIAQERVGAHHFRVVQFPMNLLEMGAVTEKNQPQDRSVLAFAREKKLGVLVNRPLNAIDRGQVVRLADMAEANTADPEAVVDAVEALSEREARFQAEILPLLEVDEQMAQQLTGIFSAARLLRERWQGFETYYNWNDVQTRFIVPRIQSAVTFLRKQEALPEAAESWLPQYVDSLNKALRAVDAVYQARAQARAEAIKEWAAAADESWAQATGLSQMAVRALRSTSGVTSVLVGMRQPAYVDDILEELKRPVQVAEREEAWEALAAATGSFAG